MSTGIKLLTVGISYMALMFIVIGFMSSSITQYQITGGSLDDLNTTFDPTLPPEDVENVSVFDIFSGLLTFNISGLPWWVSILVVYLPLILILLGVYGIIRGI